MRKVYAAAFLMAVAALFAWSASKPEPPATLALTTQDGTKVSLAELRGKPVVVNIWATWCGPCREEMPMLVEAEKKWASRVAFVGVSLDDKSTRKNIPAFVKDFSVTYPIWVGASLNDLARLKLGNAVPDTAFLDSDGVIRFRVRGEVRREELEQYLEWLTGNHEGAEPAALVNHLGK